MLTQITWTFKKSNFQLHQPAARSTRSSNPPHAPPLPSTSQLWHLELTPASSSPSSCCPAAQEHQDLLLQHYPSALEMSPVQISLHFKTQRNSFHKRKCTQLCILNEDSSSLLEIKSRRACLQSNSFHNLESVAGVQKALFPPPAGPQISHLILQLLHFFVSNTKEQSCAITEVPSNLIL